jgi:Raf kinase inhibitor-like YbhB/YbcL family protein
MRKEPVLFLSVIILLLFTINVKSEEANKMSGLRISSPVFKNNGSIPAKYTCTGKDISPPLLIENVPPKAKSLAVIVDDPDAPRGTWVHWVLWNISPGTGDIRENSVPAGAVQGMNDFRRHDYGGPCPPSGTHRYFFKVYALDTVLNLSPNSTKADTEKAMKGHIIEQAEVIGLYEKR